jgi:biopolymer transport protein ExbD
VQADGSMYLNKTKFATATDILQPLIDMRMSDPDLNVIVRGDSHTKYQDIRSVLDVCQQANVPKVDLATEPLSLK